MDYDSVMDSSDDEFFQSPSSFLGPVDLALGRPSLRRSDHRRSLLLPSTDAVDILNKIMSVLTGDHSDESVEGDDDDSSMTDDVLTQPMGLLDLCSRVVAENYSCADLDGHNLDEALLRKISFWAFPQDVHRVRAYAYLTDRLVSWRRGVALVKDEKIKEMWQVGFMATAYIAKHGQQSDSRTKSEIRVSLMFEKQKIISSTCSECKNEVWCEHIIAAVLHKIKNPSAVRVHGPMTEALSTLDRNQLQKLLQYAVYEDPAGVLGKVFKHLDDIRDTNSEMSRTEGAPDPTYGGLSLGDKSQWDLSLELLDKRLVSDLDAMIQAGSYFNYAEGQNQEYYPDNYDIMLKMQSKFFTYITPVLELARQNEHQAAAEVMQHVANTIIQKMSSNSHTDCPNLSRLWHDLSHIFTLLLLRIDDQQARNLLVSTSQNINRIGGALLSEHMLEMSQWAELPSLTLLFPAEVTKLKEEGFTLLEPLVAKFLLPKLPELQQFLEGKDSIEMRLEQRSTYNEDLVMMIARLETLFYFEREKSFQKISRLAFMVLHKLTILAQQDSVIGAYHPLQRTSGSLGSSLFEVTMQGSNSLARTNLPSSGMLKSVFYGKGKSCRSSNKGKHPAKRFKSSVDHVTVANLNKGQVAYSMMYTLRLMIATQKATSMELENKKLVTGFCLQALELSRHRTLASSDSITAAEQDWLLKLETCICDYLQTASIDAVVDAVVMYIDTIIANGTKFYNGAYPLVLLEMLCHLCTKNDSLKTSKGRHLMQICSEILLNSTTCLEKVTIPTVQALDFFWEDGGGSLSNPRKQRDFAVRKFHVITETFLSLVGTDTPEDIDLLVQILQHFENIKTVPLLKRISKDLRMHVWRFKEEHRVIEAMLRFSIHAYRESPLNLGSETKQVESIDREFVFSLARKLGVMSLPIFSECWQNIFSCKDLQELVLFMEPKCNEGNDLPEAVLKIIMEFYDAKRFHEEDACTLLTRFFKPNDKNYDIVVNKILENFDTYHAAALFNLAKLQQERKSGRWKNAMNAEVFSIIVKAFEKISVVSAKILEYVDWVFTVCTYCIQKELTCDFHSIKDFDHCVACYQEDGHAHKMEKLELDLDSGGSTENSQQNPPEARRLSIQHYIQSLVHACICRDANCQTASCQKMKRVMLHMKSCKKKQTNGCLVCKQLIALCCYHAKHCQEAKCLVPFCMPIRQKLQQHVMQQRMQQTNSFYKKMIQCICLHAKAHPEIILKVLQSMESHDGLMAHSSAVDLRHALIAAYKEHFLCRFRGCGHAAYATVIGEMQRARLECKHYIKNGESDFDSEVVDFIRRMHSTKKKLMKLLKNDFPV